MLPAFKRYLTTLKLGPISRKLYFSDVRKFLNWLASETLSEVEGLTLSQVASPKPYLQYLDSLRALAVAPSMLKRMSASLRQFGTFLSLTYSLPNPVPSTSISPLSGSLTPNQNYIKHFTNYLNESHLSPLTIKSYKSDVTRYLDWSTSNLASNKMIEVLSDKNIKKYLNHLSDNGDSLTSTIDRKEKSLTRFKGWYTDSYGRIGETDSVVSPQIAGQRTYNMTESAFTDSPTMSTFINPSQSMPFVKKFNYRTLAFMATLLLFTATLAVFGYRQFNRDVRLTAAFPSTPVSPNRQLSFQGRLENAGGTPITTSTNFVFKLHDASSGGSELYSSGTCSITPDSDGVFSTQIGDTCGAGIASSVFTENADVWLEVTVGAETLTPRQQIATVAYALNSETIQGFPISATVSAIRNTVVPMNEWGEIIVGEQSPRLRGVAGTFQISAPSLSLITATGTNGNITLAPDGTGEVNLNGNTTTTNFFNVSNAQLTTGSLITGTVANNNTGFKLIELITNSGTKFQVDYAGNTDLSGVINIPNSNSITGVTNYTQFSEGISVGGATTYYINSAGTGNLNALTLAGTLDANGQLDLGDGGDTITLNGSSITLSGFNCAANTNGGTLTTNGSGVLQCSDDDSGSGGDGSSNWQSTLGALSPINSTWDVLVGGTATSSAKIGFININAGTPTINLANQASNISVIDNTSNALRILEGSNNYLALTTTNASENLSFGNATTNPTFSFLGTGLTTLSGGLTVNGITTIGNNSATVAINSSDWDISTIGDMSGIGTISSDGDWTNSQATPSILLTDSTASSDDYTVNVEANAFDITNSTDSRIELQFVGDGSINFGDNTTTKTIDIGGVTSSAADTINIGTNATAADIISIGNSNATTTLALTGGTAWSVTTAGNLTTNNTTVNGNTVLGNAITDTIDFQGRVLQDADLIPITTTGTNDLGSSSLAWDNLYTNAAYFAGGTSYYVDGSGNARFNDIIATDTANPGITVGDGSTGFLKVGSLTVGDNNASIVTFDTNSDATPEFQLYNTGSATASGDITMGGQLQVGRFASTPTALGAGTMIFNTTTNSFQCYNGTAWTSCGGTLFSNSNASVADGSYITVTHNLASNDLLSNAWINAQGVWKSLDASYKPAIAWEGKDTQKGVYHNALNNYIPSSETGTGTSTLHEGMIFDTFEDTTKTDSANTTVSVNAQLGDDGSSNFATLDQRIQGGRVGLMGGQTLNTSNTDNDGQTYLGSNTVNDMYYYDRSKDSIPEVLVELGIDPNWYNGVTLSVATSSASYSQNGTLADKNPNLTTSYNGSLIKATGTDSTPRTIYITIKSPTTFDWTNYQGDSATGVTITPGTAQTLGSTGVSATFTGGVNYNVGDVFKIASWYIEAESSTRGAKQQFPERSYVVANASGVDVIDSDTQKLWIRFSLGVNYNMGQSTVTATKALNGSVYGTSVNGFRQARFAEDMGYSVQSTGTYRIQPISMRNADNGYITQNTTTTIVNSTANDVDAAVIPNQPTQEVTVSGWGYIVGDGANSYVSDTVVLPYRFNTKPKVVVSGAGVSTGSTVPNSLSSCGGWGNQSGGSAQAISENKFTIVTGDTSGATIPTTWYVCYTWTATGSVSPSQFVSISTGTTSTDGGTSIINETKGSVANVSLGSQSADTIYDAYNTIANNTLYLSVKDSTASDEWVYVYRFIHSLETETVYVGSRSGLYEIGEQVLTSWSANGPVVLGSSSGTSRVTNLYSTSNTSTTSPYSNTLYISTSGGLSVIQESQGDTNPGVVSAANVGRVESSGSVKYYTKDYISEEMIGNVRGMWPMNGNNTASDFEDISVKANALTGTNITSADTVSGVRGEAYDFDGSTEYLSRADDADFDFTTSFSTSVWIKTTDTDGILFRKYQAGIEDKLLQISSSTIGFYLHNVMGGTSLFSNRTVSDNQWHFITATYDGVTAKIYIDGQLDNSKSASGSVADGTGSLYIGQNSAGAGYYAGYIDELMITATTLTSDQVRNMYQVGYRALQSHGTGLSSGTADGNQALAGASNNIGVATPDYNNQYMYVGTNHTTDGALTKIQLNSDTAIKNYDTGDNDPDGGAQIIDDDITSLAVGETLYAVGSAASGIKTMGLDNNATATSGNFVSKTQVLPKNIGSAVLWVSPILDSNDGSNTLTVQASNDGGSNYVTCTLVNTNTNYDAPEREYACTFTTADNDLKVRFQMARGSTKTNTYIVQYGISWLGETGFRVEQADNNNVRLYNFSGESQNLRLNVTGGGTSVMANPWTDGGSYIYATGYEALRIYDGAGTNYLGLSHDGTYATLGYNGTDYINLTSAGDILPETNDTQALGSDTYRWEDVFLGPGSMHIGTSTTDEGVISYDTSGNILNIGTDSTSNGDIAFFTDDLYLDKSSGNVGVGDSTPDYLFDVAGTAGFDSTVTLTGSAANISLGSNYLSGDGGDEGVYVDSSGNVGIGNSSPDRALHVTRSTSGIVMRLQNNYTDSSEYWTVGPSDSDNFAIFNDSVTGMYIAYGATSWTANSDERLKTNIEALTNVEGLSSLLQLTPINYNWKDVNTNQSKQTGFIAQEVQRLFPGLVSLGETTTITLADGTTQTIESPLGVNYTGFIPYIIKGIQEQQAQISQLLQNLITPRVNTAMISPLAPGESIEITAPVVIAPTTPNLDTPTLIVDGGIEAATISARVAQLETIRAETITARDIVADTITANNIIGLDAKIASLSAGISETEFESISDRIKARLASLTGNEANAQDVPAPPSIPETVIEYTELSTASATLATADIDFVTVNEYLAVIGQATITTLDVTNGLYSDTINSKTGRLALAENTLLIDSSGQVAINGDLTVTGKIIATELDLSRLNIYDESGLAVATIDASGSANLASLTTNMITIASPAVATQSGLASLIGTAQSNATAGQNILTTPNTELTIESPFVTPNSLVYLTPTGNTDNKVVFVKSKTTCPPQVSSSSLLEPCIPSFTVGIDAPATTDIGFNWWIIELKQ